MSVKNETMEKVENKPVQAAQEKEARGPQRVYEYSPDVDIYAEKTAVYLEANVPGVDEKGLDISIDKNVLTIKGATTVENPEGYQLKFAEYYPGNFKRSFQLGEDVDHEGIEAVVKNGVLRIKLPIKAAVSRKITVKAE